jgi:hypothetical protein
MLDLGHLNSTDWGHADVDMKKNMGDAVATAWTVNDLEGKLLFSLIISVNKMCEPAIS